MELIMSVQEEYSKKNADSPAISVPSTADTSYSSSLDSLSSPEDESNHGLKHVSKHISIRRTLFRVNKVEEDSPKETIVKPKNCNTNLVDGGENGLADTTSITSSETTAIPSWNLSMKDTAEKNVEVPLNQFILARPIPLLSSPNQTDSILSSPSSFESDQTQHSESDRLHSDMEDSAAYSPKMMENKENHPAKTEEVQKPSVVVEDPPEEPTSCNAAMNLTPVQLAEIFLSFGQSARQRYQGSEQMEKAASESSPEPQPPVKASGYGDAFLGSPPPILTSSPKRENGFVRSVERKRDALKVTMQRDANTISNLHQAIHTQKQLNLLKEVEIGNKEAELEISEQRIEDLQKEQVDYIERETELFETITILKKELDKMTSLAEAPSDELDQLILETKSSRNEIETEKLDAETQLASLRTEKQQARIAELENSLKEKERENFDLQTKIDLLKNQQKEEVRGSRDDLKAAEDAHPVEIDDENNSEKDDLIEAPPSITVEGLLKDIMKRLEAVEIEKNEKESELANESKNDSEKAEKIESQEIDSEQKDVKINVLVDPDAIETMNLKKKSEVGLELEKQSTWCCDWSLISGE
eukprot:CAMPEP_0201135362 /NCGR_PEP_ID=MMETSP0850-20130426/54274_1 /ASSEMBLY_ACC=CAM_ASM_000622 /TAXON_ID=183588 /ORGANISM="Pseudo-nitzschia fraudulenta, Strain WWA7" /LENGTH=587 /DNA_ID=CAMNT_0047406521 /DNA_START=287 /DNA_END=2050 /DNA_ORIENTATION=+